MGKIKLTLAATGLNNTDNPGPGIPVIRAIRESGEFDLRVIGLAYENLEPGIYMREMVDKVYQVPYPGAGTENLIKRLTYINSVENIDVLIPNFDAELYTFMRAEKKLAALGIRTFLPTLEQFEARHKANLPVWGKKHKIPVPRSENITDLKKIHQLPEGMEYPLFVKGQFYDAYLARNAHEATTYFNKISAEWGMPVILQEKVKGTEVNVIALGDGNGNTIGAVPMRKQYITDKGKAWGGVSLSDEKMLELTHHIIRETKWRGGMELELIRDEEDQLHVIEINPRIPAWAMLSVGAGQNLPAALVKLAMGLDVEPFKDYKAGVMFIRYSWDLIVQMEDFQKLAQNGEL